MAYEKLCPGSHDSSIQQPCAGDFGSLAKSPKSVLKSSVSLDRGTETLGGAVLEIRRSADSGCPPTKATRSQGPVADRGSTLKGTRQCRSRCVKCWKLAPIWDTNHIIGFGEWRPSSL